MWGAKEFFCSTLALEFFSNFGHFIDPFNPVFYFHFKNIKIFKIGSKSMFLPSFFFHGTISFEEESHLS